MKLAAESLTELQLAGRLDALADQLDLEIIGREIRIGAYRLDALAKDRRTGDVFVVELKVVASTNALGQLPLFRAACPR